MLRYCKQCRTLFNERIDCPRCRAKLIDPRGAVIADKYLIDEQIGSGATGIVFRASHAFTHHEVALKVLCSPRSGQAPERERFANEARIAAAIRHPGVIDIFDVVFDANSAMSYAMELLVGEDLGAAIERRGLLDQTIVDVGAQLLDALQAAHDQGLLHGDVKPRHVYLTRSPEGLRVKLLGFGRARRIEARRGSRVTPKKDPRAVSPRYRSPEQLRNELLDARADIWAVGAVLFHALAGEPPFSAETDFVLMACVVSDPAPSLGTRRPDLSPQLVACVDRALIQSREHRWPSARAMAEALRAAPMVGAP